MDGAQAMPVARVERPVAPAPREDLSARREDARALQAGLGNCTKLHCKCKPDVESRFKGKAKTTDDDWIPMKLFPVEDNTDREAIQQALSDAEEHVGPCIVVMKGCDAVERKQNHTYSSALFVISLFVVADVPSESHSY